VHLPMGYALGTVQMQELMHVQVLVGTPPDGKG
jgi:hypothetical protein